MKRMPCNDLSARQRRLTPPAFARYLFTRLSSWTGCDPLAALWIDPASYYYALWPRLDIWGESRDARTYAGPWPAICHPPCGSWGKLKHFSRQPLEDGIIAIDIVHKYGGVVEQPVGSQLFKLHGRAGARIETVSQFLYGHRAEKLTYLYWFI